MHIYSVSVVNVLAIAIFVLCTTSNLCSDMQPLTVNNYKSRGTGDLLCRHISTASGSNTTLMEGSTSELLNIYNTCMTVMANIIPWYVLIEQSLNIQAQLV